MVANRPSKHSQTHSRPQVLFRAVAYWYNRINTTIQSEYRKKKKDLINKGKC